MSKNNPLKRMVPEKRNYKLYKAKKQWITACATFMLAFGATALVNTSVQADVKGKTATPVEEVSAVSTSASNEDEQSATSQAKVVTDSQADESKQQTTENNQSVADSQNKKDPQNNQGKQPTTTNPTAQSNTDKATSQSPANTNKQPDSQQTVENDEGTTANSSQNSTADPANQSLDLAKNKTTAKIDPKTLAASKAKTQNITPIAYSSTGQSVYVLPGTNLTNDAAKFIANSKELEEAGAKISWQTVPEIPATYNPNGDMYSGTVLVTYADGTNAVVDVTDISLEATVVLNSSQYYYVPEVNEQVDDLNTPDANGNSLNTILNNGYTIDPTGVTAKLLSPLDTSEEGIHWADVQITDHGQVISAGDMYAGSPASYVIGDPYTVKIPYLVKGLKVRDDIPKDANGNPVINAQLATGPLTNADTQLAFDPVALASNNNAVGEYFYQDYALAYALGIKASFTDWTAPTDLATAKTNHFALTLSGAPNADKQTVDVNYVAAPTSDPIYLFNYNKMGYQAPAYVQNMNKVRELAKDGYLTKGVHIELPDGTSISPSDISINKVAPVGGFRSGKFFATYTATLNPTLNKAGQPLIWSNAAFSGNVASADFANEVNHWYQVTNNTSTASFKSLSGNTWQNNTNTVTVLAPTVRTSDNTILDLTDATKPYVYDNDALSTLVTNPATVAAVHKDYPTWNTLNEPNQLPDGKWPTGTTFEWLGKDSRPATLSFTKAGESQTGSIKITLPSGSEFTVENVTVTSKANVKAESKTVDYGTTLTAEQLVANKSVFPDGTTYQFVNGTEPTWNKAGSYNNVQITATYKDAAGKDITTPVATCAVAINDTRNITVLEGSTVPLPDSVLNFGKGWEEHTATWTKDINTDSINQGEITVHYPSSNLDQVIRVFVTVIPKQTAISGEEFKTNGTKFDGTSGSIANGTENQGSILINNGGQAVSYDTYNKGGTEGEPSTFKQTATNYTPTYSLTGLQTNKDGSLVSGPQNVTVRVSVPKGTIGAQVDSNGNYYYDVATNIVVAQPVTFELVDDDENGKVLSSQTQQFIKDQATTIAPVLTIPENYELAENQTLPTTYSLKNYSATNIIEKIHLIHKTETVDPTDPDTNPTKDTNWFKNQGLIKDVTRTINYEGLTADQLAEIPDSEKTQTVEFTRTAKYDLVTGKIVVGSEGDWTVKGTDNFAGFKPTKFDKLGVKSITDAAGQSIETQNGQVPEVTGVTDETKNSTITVTYTEGQNVTFEFVDVYNNDEVVGQTYDQVFVPGQDTKLNFTMTLPAGKEGVYNYVLADGATIPTSYTLDKFTDTSIVVKVGVHQSMHFTIKVHDETENKDIGSVVVPTANAGNGGYDPNFKSQLQSQLPAGVTTGDYESVSVSGVPDGATFTGNYEKPLTDATTEWWVPNYKWDKTTAVEKALTGATITINVKHKIQETTEQQTRTATVNYVKAKVNDDGTYTEDGNAFGPAVVDVYYSRTKKEDLVTKKSTYTPWLWDTTQGDHGYHVASGKWTNLPQEWGAVTADVPTLNGYTAAVVTDKSGKPANEFVYPTWNGEKTDPKQASLAYTKDATAYEAQPVHTVLYIPVETQSRTVTAKFKIAGGDRDGQEIAPEAQAQIFYNRTGALNVNNNTITYGDWAWDDNAGDKNTPGFHVISGSWTFSKTAGNTWQVNVPTIDGYTAVTINNTDSYSTFTFASPSYYTNTQFTNSTANQWFMRNELTTYYVPNSMLNKLVTRTITITEPGKEPTTQTQKVTLTRSAKVNNDDTGVVYGDWSTGNWVAQDVPTHEGYTLSVTQTVDGKTTPIELVNGQVPVETVNGTTQDTTINITYGAVATAKLTGNGSSTYNGQAITNTELNNGLHVTVTGPTANSGIYTLQSGDVEFSTDGTNWTTTMPTNAGDYQVRLTDQGENGIRSQFGNNSIIWTDGDKSTITSDATWIINKLASDSVMANAKTGNYEMTYNGAAPSSIDPSKFTFTTTVNGKTVTLKSDDLTSADFSWVDGSAPVNVGTYQVKLNADGLTKLQADNPNFTLTNTGNGTFTINQASASAVLSGSGTRAYNGSAVTVDDLNASGDGNNITLTLHYPKNGDANYSTTVKLSAGDFTWNTPDGSAPVNASASAYTINLNNDAIQKIINQAVGTGQNGVSNVKFANDAIRGTASYTITPLSTAAVLANTEAGNYGKVYDAQVTNQIDPAKFQITATVNGKVVTLNTTGLTGGSYEWVNATGNPLAENPKSVGTYYVKLTDAGFTTLKADTPNFTLTNTGLGIYTITPANATATLSGSNSKVYDGSAISTTDVNNGGDIKVSVNFPGVDGQTYTLKQGDYTISSNATDAGDYTITLTDAGIANIENYIKSLAGSGQKKQSNVEFAADAVSGTANFTITPSANVVSVGGTQTETYKGSAYNVVYNADGTNSVTVSIAKADGNTTGALASLTKVQLGSDDFEITDGSAINAGSYKVALTTAGLAKVQNALGKNYTVSASDTTGTLQIDKATGSVTFSGNPTKTYDGSPISDYLSKYKIVLDAPNNPSFTLKQGDIEFKVNGQWTTEAPANVGKYEVRLSQQGWNNIKKINSDNVKWAATASAGEGTYTITQAQVTAALSGSNSRAYNGSAVTTADLYADGSTIKVVIDGTGIANLPKTFTLTDGDYQWQTTDNAAPKNVGTYTIKLTASGIENIQKQINQAVGSGNVALITTADNAGSASFEIKQAVASNVQLYGHEQSTYDGSPVSFVPTDTEAKKNYGFNNVENLTVPTFTSDDFSWYDADGNAISAPTNAGTYYLKLNDQGKTAFANANPNYTFEDQGKSTITGQITYVINPAALVIGVSGSASKVYDGEDAVITQDQIDSGQIKLVWGNSETEPTGLGQFTLTPDDLEVVDSEGKVAKEANAGENADGSPVKGTPYQVRLTAAAIEKIKQLSGANNYTISQTKDSSGDYYIYEHKAEVTLTGNQTTVYGTALPFDPSKYTLDFTNWVDAGPAPVLTWKDGKLYNNGVDTGISWTAGDLYVVGYPNGGVPTDVGNYAVKISKSLTDKLRQLFPNYDFSGNVGKNGTVAQSNNTDVVEPSHTPASYVITPAVTTVTINGAEHVKYGNSTAIQDGQYTASVTAPVNGVETPVVTKVALTAADLTTVPANSDVGSYTIKLTAAGLVKIQDAITGHGDVTKNYNWKQAASARASFYVNQMPVTIAVSGKNSVTYGSSEWLNAIKANPSDYTLTVTTENGTKLNYTAQDGDLVFSQMPGNVDTYQVELSAQGLANIEQALGTNYAYPQTAANVTAKGTFTVNQGQATVTLKGSDGKTYDAKQTLPAGLDLSKYSVEATVYSPDGKSQTLTLTNDDLKIVGNATNVGTYQVELSQAGQEKLKNLTGNNGANYKWTFDTNADYKITAAEATAELEGTNEKVFDGQPVTTAEVNSNGQILVHFTFPGSTTASTYTLQDDDYTWADGSAPTNAGTYTINLNKDAILQHLQNALNNQAGAGNVTINTGDLSGTATFKITPKEITNVTISGDDQSKIYDGKGASLDVSGLTIKADGTVTDKPLVDTDIKASDFDWYDGDTKLDSVPTDAGTYQARLKASVLKDLQSANPDYSFNAVNGVINYTINPAKASATISGSGMRDYNAQGTSIADVLNDVSWTPTGLVTGQDLNLTGISADSYVWYSRDAQGNLVAMTGNPTNAGTYYLKLSDAAIAQIKKDNPNYSFADNAITGEYTYTINAVTGDATLSGSNSKTYDGQPVSTAEIDSANGNIIVKFTFPGSTVQSTYTLQDGNYTWENNENPVNAGTYTLKLSDQGLAHLQDAVNAYAGSGNVVLSADSLKGSATFTIDQKPLAVNLTDKATTPDGKTYDGQPAIINHDEAKFNADGLIDGESLNTTNLTDADYEWVDADGKKIDAPTDAGTYYIALTKAGLAQLQKANPNYKITEQGRFKYVIVQAAATVTIGGSQESTSTEIDPSKFPTTLTLGNNPGTSVSGLTADDYQFVDDQGNPIPTPTEAGTYKVALTPAAIAKLQKDNPNYKIPASTTAPFTLDATLNIIFQDADEDNAQVGKTLTKSGAAESQIDLGLTIPAGYKLATGQKPLAELNNYTFGKALTQYLYIKLAHKTRDVTPTDPIKPGEKTPTDKVIDGAHESDLNETITRTINITYPAGRQPAGDPTTVKQNVSFERTATVDEVTGKVTYGKWTFTKSNAKNGNAQWDAYTAPVVDGYTAKITDGDKSIESIDKTEVTDKTKSVVITISYTANKQSVTIKFVDDNKDGKQVDSNITKNGVTDQTIDNLDLSVPEHYELATGQKLPTSYKFTAAKDQVITIHLIEKKVTVDPIDPKTNPTKDLSWFTNRGLKHEVTRTIKLADGTVLETQPATITRTATYNEVTGDLTNFSEWTKASWPGYQVPNKPGYTAKIEQTIDNQTTTINSIDKVAITAETKPETITIAYTANEQTGKISYVDGNGNEISTTPISGKTDETVDVTPNIPVGWEEVPGQDIPKTVKATPDGVPTVTIKIQHKTILVTPETPEKDIPTGKVPGDPTKTYEKMESLTVTPRRTITVELPDGIKKKVMQTVEFTRTATFDEVTGKISYSDWKVAKSDAKDKTAQWDAYTAPAVDGYTADKTISAQKVNATDGDASVNISYTANQQAVTIKFVDDKDQQVGAAIVKTGVTDETISDLDLTVPAHYKLATGQQLPTSYTFTADKDQSLTIHLTAKLIKVDPTDPQTNPDPSDPNWFINHELSHTATRTILNGDAKPVEQSATITRTATYNEVTGELTNLGAWTNDSWSAYQVANKPGYTAKLEQTLDGRTSTINSIDKVSITPETKNVTVVITYLANEQTGQIIYQDKDGKEISHTDISGKTGETVKVTPVIPTNWQIIPGQNIPESVVAGPDGIKPIVIVIEPQVETSQQTKTITRTIIEHLPSGDKKIVQTVSLTGTEKKNMVTGDTTVSWNTGKFDAYTPTKIDGYTANLSQLAMENVTASTTDQTIVINYTPNKHENKIIYRNNDGNEIGSEVISGQTGEQIKITPRIPAGWQPVPGQEIPTTVTVTDKGIPTVVIKIEHKTILVKPGEKAPTGPVPGTPSANYDQMEKLVVKPTRTIIINYPDGSHKRVVQTVSFTRTATFDEVTGKATYSSWVAAAKPEWPMYDVPAVEGYTASQQSVAAETVTPQTGDQTITISYKENSKPDQPVTPGKPAQPIVPDEPTQPSQPQQPNTPIQPATPGQPTNPGQPVPSSPSQGEGTNKSETTVKRVANDHFVSAQLANHVGQKKQTLPQTGNTNEHKSTIIGFAIASLAGIFGLTGAKKKRDQK
ncbi:KxYKxGKxW signal peptide domain-containing protein [Limosilactobacillus sp. STM2_1]|uniref:KxYKxGKxW signal peptide domain-containing protein n=1 Tax=Limosilactobacillus rudii TaxID=2759755 RepID=A0A7W3UL85_9LACO|nr:MBG domain-containing protein [Limosilactobacillus rudii]MBB1079593.1 KxYKxGKxW signal peptide domain-containing protein [Limosilactobacillus rudii]MBB1097639.1 KxYKxGKxW signal peptide domain-containing protein [Limosilactobacillus rudii]MCD7134748.1 KxYKxGKxW signal peptide domain-containing protein [Limosilactobacillus rudii]